MIRYYLPEKQWMSLTVFDMNGHPVVYWQKEYMMPVGIA
jgi:hypothetical protein